LRPPELRVASITSGLSHGTWEGEIRSSHCRTVKAAMQAAIQIGRGVQMGFETASIETDGRMGVVVSGMVFLEQG
jgi:hypothetical protein